MTNQVVTTKENIVRYQVVFSALPFKLFNTSEDLANCAYDRTSLEKFLPSSSNILALTKNKVNGRYSFLVNWMNSTLNNSGASSIEVTISQYTCVVCKTQPWIGDSFKYLTGLTHIPKEFVEGSNPKVHIVETEDTAYFCCSLACKASLELTPNIYI